jgi:Flp pilus assembly protein TadG
MGHDRAAPPSIPIRPRRRPTAARLSRVVRRFRRCESGAEFVEFALAFPLLLLVVLGIMEFGLLFQQYEVITNAAREGARVAVLPNYTATDVQNRVDQYIAASFLSTGGTVATVVGAPQSVAVGASCMSTITVTVTYPHQILFLAGIGSYFGQSFGTKTLTASSTMRTEVAAASC